MAFRGMLSFCGIALLGSAAACACWAGTPAVPSSPAYNMNLQFDITSNPNGVWSYLVDGSPLPVAETQPRSPKHVKCWATEKPIPDSVEVCRNYSGTTVDQGTVRYVPHYLLFDPENHVVTVRWTAPTAGVFMVIGDFIGLDIYEKRHPVAVLLNGTTVLSDVISTYGQRRHFNRDLTVMAGDTVDFQTKVGTNYTNLSTGVRAKIIPVQP